MIATPEAPEDERIDVGVAIVGGGPAGLAAAIRLGQLLADDPALTEQLGEVPIALVDKGRTVGSHQLSGAVVNPAALRELLPGVSLESLTSYGEVRREAVHFLTEQLACAAPADAAAVPQQGQPRLLARAARARAGRAGRGARGDAAARDRRAARCSSRMTRCEACAPATRACCATARRVPAFEPGAELHASVTVLADGVQGLLTSAAIDRFGAPGREPAGVRARREGDLEGSAARSTGSSTRSAGRCAARAKYHEFGGSFIYPMGDDLISLGFVAGLDSADASLSVHDLLQELKTHPLVARAARGRRARRLGREGDPRGRLLGRCPRACRRPARVICGDAAGFVNVPKLKGVHYAMRSGMLAAETIYEALKRPEADVTAPGALGLYDAQVRESEIWSDLHRVRNMRQAFQKGLVVGGALAGMMDTTGGALPPGRFHQHADAEQALFDGARTYPAPDGKLTFDKLSSVFLSGNRSRDDQPDHIRIQQHGAEARRPGLGLDVPGATSTRSRTADADGQRRGARHAVELRPVRRDHRQGRTADRARGWQRARVHADVSEDEAPEGLVPRFARPHLRAGDPTGWFEPVYAAAGDDITEVPWVDLEPNRHLVAWLEREGAHGEGRRAAIVGCGTRGRRRAAARARLRCDRLRHLADRDRLGSAAVSGGAVRGGGSAGATRGARGVVRVRVRGVHAAGAARRRSGTRRSTVSRRSLAPGGTLLVVTFGRGEDEDPGRLPWPFTRGPAGTVRGAGPHRGALRGLPRRGRARADALPGGVRTHLTQRVASPEPEETTRTTGRDRSRKSHPSKRANLGTSQWLGVQVGRDRVTMSAALLPAARTQKLEKPRQTRHTRQSRQRSCSDPRVTGGPLQGGRTNEIV